MAKTGTQHPDGPDTVGGRARPLRVLQLTDLHLYADPDGRLLGQSTRLAFESVIALAQRLRWPPDALVLTGDLIHDESLEGYRFLRERLEQLGVDYFCIPGNHDRVDLLAGYLDAGAIAGFRVESLGGWDLVLLDSTLPFDEGGHIEPTILADLERHVSDHPERPQLILLHHHPAPVGSRWIDTMRVDNGAELLAAPVDIAIFAVSSAATCIRPSTRTRTISSGCRHRPPASSSYPEATASPSIHSHPDTVGSSSIRTDRSTPASNAPTPTRSRCTRAPAVTRIASAGKAQAP